VLPTGGTAGALCDLVRGLGADVLSCAFLIELSFLGGRARLAPHPVHALIEYTE
jgi:adenine phosphoribosyltransferase